MKPRSIQARDTLIAAVVSAVVLTAIAAAVGSAIRQAVTDHVRGRVHEAAAVAASTGRPPAGTDATVQFFSSAGALVASTANTARLSTLVPTAAHPVADFTTCPGGTSCLAVEAIRLGNGQSGVVYAASPLPDLLVGRRLEMLLAAIVISLTGLVALATWHMVGRTLKPLRALDAQLALISRSDVTSRLPQPPGDNEIARLARTANATLDRLDQALSRQRRFSADASHELRTPIAGLRAQIEAALLYPDDTDLCATLRAALRDTQRLEGIVTDLLLMARVGSDHGEARACLDLSQLVADELDRRTYPFRGRLAQHVEVRAAPEQLRRLVANLLDNAERHARHRIDVRLRHHGSTAVLTVTDDGSGIAAADRERVFERFTRLAEARNRDAGGTGLGLAIARDIAVAHQGTLRATARPDGRHGAHFVLILPATATSSAQLRRGLASA